MPLIDALIVSYSQDMPVQTLRLLEMLDPLLRNSNFWQEMRTAISAASQYMSWINDKLEQIGKQGQTVDISTLFPDINEVCYGE